MLKTWISVKSIENGFDDQACEWRHSGIVSPIFPFPILVHAINEMVATLFVLGFQGQTNLLSLSQILFKLFIVLASTHDPYLGKIAFRQSREVYTAF